MPLIAQPEYRPPEAKHLERSQGRGIVSVSGTGVVSELTHQPECEATMETFVYE